MTRGSMYAKATIRPFRSEDESYLFLLAQGEFGGRETWDEERTIGSLQDGTIFVAELRGEPAGYVAVEAGPEAVRVRQLLVSAVHEGEGVGKQLLEYAEGFAISQGARRLEIVVEDDNTRAVAFYRSRGFVPAGDVYALVLPQGSAES